MDFATIFEGWSAHIDAVMDRGRLVQRLVRGWRGAGSWSRMARVNSVKCSLLTDRFPDPPKSFRSRRLRRIAIAS